MRRQAVLSGARNIICTNNPIAGEYDLYKYEYYIAILTWKFSSYVSPVIRFLTTNNDLICKFKYVLKHNTESKILTSTLLVI